MTINSTIRKAGPFIGNGTASSFPFTYKVFQASDLDVVRLDESTNIETTLALTTDYTVVLNQDQDSNPGGTVTLVAGPLATGYTLTMTSDVPNLQPTDLTNQGGFYPEVINDALDRATIQIQQLQEQTDRSLKVALSSDVDATLPPPSPNDLIGWDADAAALVNVDPTTIGTVVAYSTAFADVFIGNGITTSWTLTRPAAVLYNLDVSINGSTQEPGRDYTLSGTTFTMTTPPPIGARVLVKYKEGLPNYEGDSQDVRFVPYAASGTVTRSVQAKLRESISVLDFGADPTGATDSTNAFKAALAAAKGADQNASGRSVFSLYVPSFPGGFYRISDTLVIDGTHGLHLFGDGAFTQRNGYPSNVMTHTIRWYGGRKPIIQVKGQTGTPSNPNFAIKIEDLTISGYPTAVAPGSIPANMALSGIHVGNIDGYNDNTLTRNLMIENVVIENCRFGIWGGNPDGLNTDHAQASISHSQIYNCPQAGIVWGTGNAIVNIFSNMVALNGWGGASFPADDYSPQVGANIHVQSGYVDIISNTSAGADTYKPTTADIYQGSGRVSIINAWSDTHGYFFRQGSVSQNEGAYHCGQITGVRHYEGTMSEASTPDSILIVCPGTTINSCMVYGNVVINSGLSGRPIINGINFARDNATIKGTGVDTQRSLVWHGTRGNFGQSFYGGVNAGQSFGNTGSFNSHLIMKGRDPGVLEVADAAAGGTNMQWWSRTDDADGAQTTWLMNCYYDTATSSYYALQNTKACWRLEFGGRTHGFWLYVADPNGSSGALTWIEVGGWLTPTTSGMRSERAFKVPTAAGDPTFLSGDYWKGGIYFNTTTNKLRINVGGGTWQDCN